jgi:hypothetical protein
MTTSRIALQLLLFAALQVGCDAPTAIVSSVHLGIVRDAKVFTVIEAFQIHILKATTTAGSSVTCTDIPSSFRLGDPLLVPAVDPVAFSWTKQTVEAHSPEFRVPAQEELLLVVVGLARYSQGVHTVARGCLDNLTFSPGASQGLDIDVRATTGAGCASSQDCETDLVCQKDAAFPGGYCAKAPCAADVECPPGTQCVKDATLGGICLADCDAPADCDTSYPRTYDCQGRLARVGSACPSVCVYPTWSSGTKCTQ